MGIPENLILQGAEATGEEWRDNYQTPSYILDKVAKFFCVPNWYDPCPADPQFDGLTQEWRNNAYINPPFSQYASFVDKGIQELNKACSEQIWLLENVKTETQYAQKILSLANAICFLNKRIQFIDPRTGEPLKVLNKKTGKFVNGSNRVGHLLIYIGKYPLKFRTAFSELGIGAITLASTRGIMGGEE